MKLSRLVKPDFRCGSGDFYSGRPTQFSGLAGDSSGERFTTGFVGWGAVESNG